MKQTVKEYLVVFSSIAFIGLSCYLSYLSLNKEIVEIEQINIIKEENNLPEVKGNNVSYKAKLVALEKKEFELKDDTIFSEITQHPNDMDSFVEFNYATVKIPKGKSYDYYLIPYTKYYNDLDDILRKYGYDSEFYMSMTNSVYRQVYEEDVLDSPIVYETDLDPTIPIIYLDDTTEQSFVENETHKQIDYLKSGEQIWSNWTQEMYNDYYKWLETYNPSEDDIERYEDCATSEIWLYFHGIYDLTNHCYIYPDEETYVEVKPKTKVYILDTVVVPSTKIEIVYNKSSFTGGLSRYFVVDNNNLNDLRDALSQYEMNTTDEFWEFNNSNKYKEQKGCLEFSYLTDNSTTIYYNIPWDFTKYLLEEIDKLSIKDITYSSELNENTILLNDSLDIDESTLITLDNIEIEQIQETNEIKDDDSDFEKLSLCKIGFYALENGKVLEDYYYMSFDDIMKILTKLLKHMPQRVPIDTFIDNSAIEDVDTTDLDDYEEAKG